MDNFQKVYARRFGQDIRFRHLLWKELAEFFQQFIPENSVVLDIAAGYCEFINNIKARRKIALDINPDTKKFASSDVEVVNQHSERMSKINSGDIDVVFVSNFFEHISRFDAESTMGEIKRVLKTGGKLIVLQPSIRFASKNYWMFWDHITPIDDRALIELMKLGGFKVTLHIPRFLPYTTKSGIPKHGWLVRAYLKLPILWRFIGQQSLIVAVK